MERETTVVEAGSDLPTFHLADPRDPSRHTALCGARLLGVELPGPFVRCASCDALQSLFLGHRHHEGVRAIYEAVFGTSAKT
jgi:hypothetical protein